MIRAGLKVSIHSDDPPMFHTDIGKEYVEMTKAAEWPKEKVREFVFNGIDGSWMSEDEKRRLRQEFERDLAELDAQLAA